VLAIILLIVGSALVSPNVSAHSGGMFTLILKEEYNPSTNETTNVVVPTNADMTVNDTARWINVDDAENVTHRILVDSNSDGIYDGEDDWDSGNLTNSCEYVNGTKIDENCNHYFDIPFNETYLNMSYYDIVGKYAYVDFVFNETSGETRKVYGNVTINPDNTHLTPGFQQKPEEETEDDTKPTWLLAIAAISGIGAVVLGAMIVFGNKDES
jgi:hypothetical protein